MQPDVFLLKQRPAASLRRRFQSSKYQYFDGVKVKIHFYACGFIRKHTEIATAKPQAFCIYIRIFLRLRAEAASRKQSYNILERNNNHKYYKQHKADRMHPALIFCRHRLAEYCLYKQKEKSAAVKSRKRKKSKKTKMEKFVN